MTKSTQVRPSANAEELMQPKC